MIRGTFRTGRSHHTVIPDAWMWTLALLIVAACKGKDAEPAGGATLHVSKTPDCAAVSLQAEKVVERHSDLLKAYTDLDQKAKAALVAALQQLNNTLDDINAKMKRAKTKRFVDRQKVAQSDVLMTKSQEATALRDAALQAWNDAVQRDVAEERNRLDPAAAKDCLSAFDTAISQTKARLLGPAEQDGLARQKPQNGP